ncbi:MAG: response regulator [Chloroflexi bacterium]|jgi:DNA-binding response OmpR family regulator|nr:response regulator [Anaerolineaceae bacterium]NMB88460.1 response regulator [Chloroflexota bacterium]
MDHNAKILLVDDEETFLLSTADLLRREGYECMAVLDCPSAVRELDRDDYDLLIADIVIEGNNDLEMVAAAVDKIGGLPVILVTGYPSLKTAVRSVSMHILAYLIKPIDFSELLEYVRMGVEKYSLIRTVQTTRLRFSGWLQDLEGVIQSLEQSPDQARPVQVDAFTRLLLQNIASSLSDLQAVNQILNGDPANTYVCQLLQCPRSNTLIQALRDTTAVLESTKNSFKSKELGQLRKRLQTLLDEETGPQNAFNTHKL